MSRSAWEEQTVAKMERMEDALGCVEARSGIGAVDHYTPLREIADLEEEEREAQAMSRRLKAGEVTDAQEALDALKKKARLDGMDELLGEIFADGYHPGMAMRRLYAFAIQRRPDLVAGLNRADAGSMFSETRAAFQERMRMIFEPRGMRSRTQKLALSVERMRRSAAGNRNRANGAKKKLILKNAREKIDQG